MRSCKLSQLLPCATINCCRVSLIPFFFVPNCAKNILENDYSVINSLFFRKEFSGKAIFFFVDSPQLPATFLWMMSTQHHKIENKNTPADRSVHIDLRLAIRDTVVYPTISTQVPHSALSFWHSLMCNNQPHLRLSDNKWGGIKLEILHIFHSSSYVIYYSLWTKVVCLSGFMVFFVHAKCDIYFWNSFLPE